MVCEFKARLEPHNDRRGPAKSRKVKNDIRCHGPIVGDALLPFDIWRSACDAHMRFARGLGLHTRP